jgi:hypothetical protein
MVHDGRPPPDRRLGPPKSKSAPLIEVRELAASAADRAALLEKVTEAAREELTKALMDDGAKDEKAEKAIAEISQAVVSFTFERGGGVDLQGEIARLAEALREAQNRIEGLSKDSRELFEGRLRIDRRRFGLFGWKGAVNAADQPRRSPLAAFRDVERDLPLIIEALHTMKPKRGQPRNAALDTLIARTASAWRDASGEWPSGERRAGDATAPLYHYLARHCGDPLTNITWTRSLKRAIETSDGLLGPTHGVRKRGRRRK